MRYNPILVGNNKYNYQLGEMTCLNRKLIEQVKLKRQQLSFSFRHLLKFELFGSI